ncbi:MULTISPECIES: hypothetical protein [Mycolicibacterium]|uniref:PE domain-containing protein n=2 Tax=Mycolicibacterium wolinskyi TaxID=59750 RepID=A0A132PME6_9MYCO|nr:MULTISPECIES: hypothetical protein [Mycolicibacterium]KWX23510.1 hypothetical protein AFM11_14670 [Mycolicibacterium wolinskyi]
MSSGLTAVPVGMAAFATANATAGEVISAAGSADSAAMLAAAATAIGPIGATYLAAYGRAQATNLAGTLLVGGVHAGIGGVTSGASAGLSSADSGFSA